MKENKNCQLKFRLTERLKQEIEDYCEVHSLNVSEFIRMACVEVLARKPLQNKSEQGE
jgi:antitoxin component of RelBE/YafQ-DinJ toxin-antitoxin module